MLTFKKLYERMGELCLYDLRDELLEWKNKNDYKFRDTIPSDLPEKFLKKTLEAMRKRNSKIIRYMANMED